MNRRKFITNLLAAPFIVRTPKVLMPIKAFDHVRDLDIGIFYCPYIPLSINIETVVVQAKSRMLKTTWTQEISETIINAQIQRENSSQNV